MVQTISIDQARHLAVIAQGLGRRPRGAVTADRLLATVEQLVCVQLDTISVVARSHETTLWSRLGRFDPGLVWSLYGDPAGLTEYWAHAAAIVPASMLPLFRPAMDKRAAEVSQPGGWRARVGDAEQMVLEAIRHGGPRMSRDFERPAGDKPGPWTWYGGKPAKEALDLLWTIGTLTVVDRVGFQRVYDLTERLHTGFVDSPPPSEAEVRRALARRALRALGIATAPWLSDYFRTGSRAYLNAAAAKRELEAMAAEGEAIRISVEGIEAPLWMAPESRPILAGLDAGRGKPALTTLLSPFDNLVWQRRRTIELFGFTYLLEIYALPHKRRWGYYTMPILHRGRLIGRLDPHYDRKARRFLVRAVYLEPGQRPTSGLAAAIAETLRDYTDQLGGGQIIVERSEPESFGPLLRESLASP